MSVSAPFIARPVATSLLAVAVLLGSILAYLKLPISSLPQVDFPVIQVTTQLPGASAETMASLVTAPLERQLGQIPALTSISSTSSQSLSQITLQFALDRDINAAGQDVQSAISAAEADLPDGLPYPPTYAKVNPSDPPIITLALTSENIPMERLSDLGDTFMTPRLSQVSGVGHVAVQGRMRPAVRIQADLSRLAAYGISMETLRTAISEANVTGAKGTLNGAQKAFTIGANDQLEDADSYRDVVVAYSQGAPILLKDVAKIVSGLENVRASGRYNGVQAVVIDVQGRPHQSHAARARARASRWRHGGNRRRPHGDHQGLGGRGAVRPRLEHRPCHHGGARFPAHLECHPCRGHHVAAIPRFGLRLDVVCRFQPRQSVADGAHHRDRLRRRRRHRHDREYRPLH